VLVFLTAMPFLLQRNGQYFLPIRWWSTFNLPMDVLEGIVLASWPVPGSSWSCSGDSGASIPWVQPDSTPPDRYCHHSLLATTKVTDVTDARLRGPLRCLVLQD
jgi:hypothetical protein